MKFSTLPGFVIERVNPPAKNDSYVALTFDSFGRLVVSKELDHPRLLLDNDSDGVYESEKIITDNVRNCQGLWFDGRAMYGSCVHVAEAPEQPQTPPAVGVASIRTGPPEFSRWRTRMSTTSSRRSRLSGWPVEFRNTVRYMRRFCARRVTT